MHDEVSTCIEGSNTFNSGQELGSQELKTFSFHDPNFLQIALTHIANVAMNRLTVTNDITSWKSSLIGKTLLRCLYVYLLFYFCS